jgi:hypothetical protein
MPEMYASSRIMRNAARPLVADLRGRGTAQQGLVLQVEACKNHITAQRSKARRCTRRASTPWQGPVRGCARGVPAWRRRTTQPCLLRSADLYIDCYFPCSRLLVRAARARGSAHLDTSSALSVPAASMCSCSCGTHSAGSALLGPGSLSTASVVMRPLPPRRTCSAARARVLTQRTSRRAHGGTGTPMPPAKDMHTQCTR